MTMKIIVIGSRTMKTRKFFLIFITFYTILFLGRGLQLIGINWLIYPVYFLAANTPIPTSNSKLLLAKPTTKPVLPKSVFFFR